MENFELAQDWANRPFVGYQHALSASRCLCASSFLIVERGFCRVANLNNRDEKISGSRHPFIGENSSIVWMRLVRDSARLPLRIAVKPVHLKR